MKKNKLKKEIVRLNLLVSSVRSQRDHQISKVEARDREISSLEQYRYDLERIIIDTNSLGTK